MSLGGRMPGMTERKPGRVFYVFQMPAGIGVWQELSTMWTRTCYRNTFRLHQSYFMRVCQATCEKSRMRALTWEHIWKSVQLTCRCHCIQSQEHSACFHGCAQSTTSLFLSTIFWGMDLEAWGRQQKTPVNCGWNGGRPLQKNGRGEGALTSTLDHLRKSQSLQTPSPSPSTACQLSGQLPSDQRASAQDLQIEPLLGAEAWVMVLVWFVVWIEKCLQRVIFKCDMWIHLMTFNKKVPEINRSHDHISIYQSIHPSSHPFKIWSINHIMMTGNVFLSKYPSMSPTVCPHCLILSGNLSLNFILDFYVVEAGDLNVLSIAGFCSSHGGNPCPWTSSSPFPTNVFWD